MDTYVYKFEKNLYVNLTNRCNNNCAFCLRKNMDGIAGNNLWMKKEATSDEIISLIAKYSLDEYEDVVFCGYGESTYRVEELKTVAAFVHSIGKKTRLDTNGLGNELNGRDIVPELKGLIDKVSISLNQKNAAKYNEISRSIYGERAFDIMLDFTDRCVAAGMDVLMTVVDVIPKEDIAECSAIAAAHGAKFRVREYIK